MELIPKTHNKFSRLIDAGCKAADKALEGSGRTCQVGELDFIRWHDRVPDGCHLWYNPNPNEMWVVMLNKMHTTQGAWQLAYVVADPAKVTVAEAVVLTATVLLNYPGYTKSEFPPCWEQSVMEKF
jgi:hypothetical protein